MHPYESEAIIYLASGDDDPFNQAIAKNYSFIFNRFRKEAGITFIYLPKLLLDKGFQRMMSYNYPYICHYADVDLRELTHQIKKQYDINTDSSALVYIAEAEDKGQGFEFESPSGEITCEHLAKQIDAIQEKIKWIRNKNEILEEQDSDIRFMMVDDPSSGIFSEVGEEYGSDAADANFDRDAFEIPRDLKERINELKEAGYLSKLIEFLEQLQNTTRKLSRLRITNIPGST